MQCTRREFLALGTYAGLVLAGCGRAGRDPVPIAATAPEVRAAERRRRRAGAVREVTLTAAPVTLDLAGLTVDTWAYNGAVPGPEVRVSAGEVLRARVVNRLPEPTTVHWHGIALRNDMDGVEGVTQQPIAPGAEFTYEFTVPHAGSFWLHPHSGLQLDRGLYAPLVVDHPDEPGDHDREYTVVLDDWVDGIGAPPDEALADLRAGRGAHAAHGDVDLRRLGRTGELLGGHAGDVTYPLFLVNGRPPRDPVVFEARPGERLRLRIVNAGADTPFRVALGGHQLTVVAADGFPVEPVTVDALLVTMAERFDVVVTVREAGVFPLVARAEGKGNQALALVRSGPGTAPPADVRPAELEGRILTLGDLRAAPAVALPERRPDRTHPVVLGGGTKGYAWTLNGRTHGHEEPLPVRTGELVRLEFENRTTMFHPMHLHGHHFQVRSAGARRGPRKDTVLVRPDEKLAVDVLADNPGQWMLHCHNLYHMAGGMMTTLSYVR